MRLEPKLVPSLLVRDLAETLTFYETLGFEVTGRYPSEPPLVWAEVARDGVVIQLYTKSPEGTPSTPVFSGTLYMFPEDVTALADELRTRIEFAWGPEVMNYGMREFGIQDPNGYYLAFTEPA